MRPRAIRRWLLVVTGAAACLGLGNLAAFADAPVDQGWWTVSNPGAPAPVPAQPPPDVPADGLLVQGGPTDPVALAGLIFEPEASAVAQQLVLKVASPSATTAGAVLMLCPLDAPALKAEQGGPIADAPAYDCTQNVTAARSADGSSYTFALHALDTVGPLAVAVLSSAPTDRVVLAKPGDEALVTTAPTSVFSPTPFPSEPESTTAPPDPEAEPPALGGGGVPAITPPVPAATPAPTVAPSPTAAAVRGSVVPPADAASTGGEHHKAVGALLLALLATGCALWACAGRGPGLSPLD